MRDRSCPLTTMSYIPPPPPASNNSLYDSITPELIEGRQRARELMYRFNTSAPTIDGAERRQLLADLLCVPIDSLKDVYVEPP